MEGTAYKSPTGCPWDGTSPGELDWTVAVDSTVLRAHQHERGIDRFEHWRGLATRNDKSPATTLGGLHLGSILV